MRKKIGELLIESGVLNPEQVRKALGQQRAHGQGQRLGLVIITLGFAEPASVARALARQFDLPFVQLPEEIPQRVRGLVPLDFQAEHRFVLFGLEPEGRGERLLVAVDDPSDLTVVGELSFQLNKPIRVHVAAEDDIDRALDLVSGRVVGLLAPEDDAGEPPLWAPLGEGLPPSSAAAAVSALLDWELPPAPSPKRVPVVVFGGAAEGLPQPPPAPRPPHITDEDLKVLEDLERMADGGEATLHTEKVKPARMVASLIRLLIRKRIIREEEFLEELSRK